MPPPDVLDQEEDRLAGIAKSVGSGSLGRCWYGIAGFRGDIGIAFSGGLSYVTLYNAESVNRKIYVLSLILGTGVHFTLQAGHVVALATNIDTADDLDGQRFTGSDVLLDLGYKFGAARKLRPWAEAAVRAVNTIVNQPGSLGPKVLRNLFENVIRGWAGYQAGTPNFMLFSTPLGGGASLGVVKETQKLYAWGANLWDLSPPRWRLERQAGALTLHLEGIPEPTCTPLFVQFIDQDATIFNRDDVMVPGRTPVVPAPVTGMPFVGHALALGRVLFGEALDRHGLGADPTEGLVARTDRDGRGHLVPVKYASCFPGFAMYGKLMEVPRERVGISTGLSGLHKIPFTNYGNEAVVDLKLRVWGSEKARPTPDRLLWESEDAVPVGMDTKTCTMQRILEAGSASGDSVCSPWKH